MLLLSFIPSAPALLLLHPSLPTPVGECLSLLYLTARRKTCTEPSPGLFPSGHKGWCRSGYQERLSVCTASCGSPERPASRCGHGALLIPAGRLE